LVTSPDASVVAPSEDALWLLDASVNARVVKTFPMFTKVALIKLLPVEAARWADAVESVLSEQRVRSEVARAIDRALDANTRAEARARMTDVDYRARMAQVLGDTDASPGSAPHAPSATTRALFSLLRPEGDADKLAQAPLLCAVRVGRAGLPIGDVRRDELQALARTLEPVPRAREAAAFIAKLSVLSEAEMAMLVSCFHDGPCAVAERAVLSAHLTTVERLGKELEARVQALQPG
jgi:hypothetical protein